MNIKKYTKDQMAKMVEEAQEEAGKAAAYEKLWRVQVEKLESQSSKLKAQNAALTEQIDQMNGEAINKANEIANLKADADALRVQLKNANDTAEAVSKELQRVNSENDGLRNKLTDTEAALERANAELTYSVTEKNELNAKIKQLGGNLHYHKSRSDELDYYKNLLSNANEAQAQIRDNLAKAHWERDDAKQRANYAEDHPWRNLWAWVKRKLVRHK